MSSSLSSSCAPSSGQTLLTIGQDLFSIQEYVREQYNASLHRGSTDPVESFHPAAAMFYTDIQTLRGLEKPVDYGSGIEYAEGLANNFPNSGIQIGLWLNGTQGCGDIVTGTLDANVERLFQNLRALPVPKIFLRVGYEFDNPSFGYSSDPSLYQEAFRKMVGVCETQLGAHDCHAKIAFCWHSWAAPKVQPLEAFYPGDDYVDWVGVSIFQQVYPWAQQNGSNATNTFAGGNMEQVVEVLEFAKDHGKPIMIAESTPFGGIHGEVIESNFKSFQEKATWDGWAMWFQPILDLIHKYDIQMWSYINCNWDVQPMWAGIGFGDTRLSISKHVMKSWKAKVLDNPRFLSTLNCGVPFHHHDSHHHTHHHDKHDGVLRHGGLLGLSNLVEGVVGSNLQSTQPSMAPIAAVVLLAFLAFSMLSRRQRPRLSRRLRATVDSFQDESTIAGYGSMHGIGRISSIPLDSRT